MFQSGKTTSSTKENENLCGEIKFTVESKESLWVFRPQQQITVEWSNEGHLPRNLDTDGGFEEKSMSLRERNL